MGDYAQEKSTKTITNFKWNNITGTEEMPINKTISCEF